MIEILLESLDVLTFANLYISAACGLLYGVWRAALAPTADDD